ncbi:MAG TPA: hypothetical protein PKE69_00650 [Pyrinomonadaceae bacterium]|nr:hypothetical protein [Pyrinomonadaceae bacterium]
MEEIVLQTHTIAKTETSANEIYQKRIRSWNFVLFAAMGGGIVSGLLGLVLGTISYIFAFKNAKTINFTGNFMLITAFPLMMLGAHALDKIREIEKSKKNDK